MRVFTPATGALRTLDLSSVPQPAAAAPDTAAARAGQAPPGAIVVRAPATGAAEAQVRVSLALPAGYHYTRGANSRFEAAVEPAGAWRVVSPQAGPLAEAGPAAVVTVQRQSSAGAGSALLRINCRVFYCQEESVCLFQTVSFEVPLDPAAPAAAAVDVGYSVPLPEVNASGLTGSIPAF